VIKVKNKPNLGIKLIKYNQKSTLKKGDIDEYIYSWQEIRYVSER